MAIETTHVWKALAARGAIACVFGIVAIVWPTITLLGLVLLFGVYALLDGLLAVSVAWLFRERRHRLMIAFEGLVGFGAGLTALVWTDRTALLFVDLIAFWAIVTGTAEIVASSLIRGRVPGDKLLALAGVVSIMLGGSILVWPSASAFVILTLLGFYGIFFGSTLLALALRIKRRSFRFHTALTSSLRARKAAH